MLDKSNIALICIFGMGVGFLFSMVVLSIFTFLFGVNAIRDVHPKYWVRNKWWVMSMVWVTLYALTYLWTANKHTWNIRFQTKLPFLILPLVVSYLPSFSAKQLNQITQILGGVFIISAVYTLGLLIHNPDYYINGYYSSHLLPTLPDDHIRASLAVVLFVVWCIYVWPVLDGKAMKWFTGATVALLIVYIHILAAKSGIVALYLFLLGWSIYLSFGRNKLAGFGILLAIPMTFMIAFRISPTFKHRAYYTVYGYEQARDGDKTGNYGDANRLMSYKIAIQQIQAHPLLGVGVGDMYDKMVEGYNAQYPNVPKENILLPHNQFLVIALGAGIPAMVLFAIWVLMPLTRIRRNRQSFFMFMVWLLLLMQLMIEPVLEVQYGVFVYLFFLVMMLHELPERSAKEVIG